MRTNFDSPYSIRTYTGKFFDFKDPLGEDVDIVDIARALSRKPRFNGHMNVFYSVAQHAWSVSHLVSDPNYAWAGLHHDDSEAYMADVPSPLKRLLPEYKVIEKRVQNTINHVFGLPDDAHDHPVVKKADLDALFLERDAMIDNIVRWSMEEQHPGTMMADYFPDFEPWDSEKAMCKFLERYQQLSDAKILKEYKDAA